MEVHLGIIVLHPLHSSPFVRVISHLNTLSWPHGPLHSTFSRKPNVKVATIYVSITSCFLVGAHLPYPKPGHDPPLCTIDEAVGYIILWPWKLTTKFYETLLQFATYRSCHMSCFVHFSTCRSSNFLDILIYFRLLNYVCVTFLDITFGCM
jgi:hypothetical protein